MRPVPRTAALCIGLLAIWGMQGPARAQTEGGATNFKTLKITAHTVRGAIKPPAEKGASRPATLLKGAWDDKAKRYTQQVTMTLLPEDESQKPLVLRSDEADLAYGAGGGNVPDVVEMKGNVRVDGEIGIITSEKATLNAKTKIVVFTGKVHVDAEQYKGSGSQLSVNLDTGEWVMSQADVVIDVQNEQGPGGSGGAADPSLLKSAAVLDWPGLIAKIQEQGKAAEASPGKQLYQLLGAESRKRFAAIPTNPVPDQYKDEILKQLNRALRSAKLYDAKAWQDRELGDEPKALLRRRGAAELDAKELTRLNRLLLEAAYPNMIAPAPPAV